MVLEEETVVRHITFWIEPLPKTIARRSKGVRAEADHSMVTPIQQAVSTYGIFCTTVKREVGVGMCKMEGLIRTWANRWN